MKKNSIEIKLKKELEGKVILITGGAGSVGSALAKKILKYKVHSVRILDIDEYALFKLKKEVKDNRLRPLLGTITNFDRVNMAISNVDIVIHTAAIKNIEISEFNPIETIEVNTIGTINLIKAAMLQKPKKFLNLSTDKSANPSTLYGTTKQLAERLTSWAGMHILTTKFASLRLGNIYETRGNVFELWKEQEQNNLPLTITHPLMERYFFHMDEVVQHILHCLVIMKKGEIFVPNVDKPKNIKEIATKISKKHKVIGIRQGEKMSEILLTEEEKENAVKKDGFWIINHYKTDLFK